MAAPARKLAVPQAPGLRDRVAASLRRAIVLGARASSLVSEARTARRRARLLRGELASSEAEPSVPEADYRLRAKDLLGCVLIVGAAAVALSLLLLLQ